MNVRTLAQLTRYMGPRWLAWRGVYAFKQRIGWLQRRAPASQWDALPLASFLQNSAAGEVVRSFAQRVKFFFDPADRLKYQPHLLALDKSTDWMNARLEELQRGRLRFFSGEATECGWPPLWHRNPLRDASVSASDHFSRLHEFGHGDIKVIWEPSRFSFVFDLVRIYWRTGDARCAQLFWQAVENWRDANQPNQGINWKCGQESTFRAMAWCFGLWGFLDSTESTPQRIEMLLTMLAATARRIEANIDYALSQSNNHGISEAVGLFTIGLLFPQFKQSLHWEQLGRDLLERQARELIYDDGGFSQYSANYHRVMLHDYLWAIRLADLNGRAVSSDLRNRVAAAGEFLLSVLDNQTGGVPRYGNDDGALVLPLTNCDYWDFRPVTQSVSALNDESLPHDAGPWNEELLWLFGGDATEATVARRSPTDVSAPEGGYETLRREDNFAFLRCGAFQHRPAHADLLHVDIWWRGHNVAIDPGTYSYNAEGAWADIPFARTPAHNTITVDEQDQMQRASRFLFLPWPKSIVRCKERSNQKEIALLEAEHEGYLRLADPVRHQRAVIQLGEEHWVIIDRLKAAHEHLYHLHWLLKDAAHQLDGADFYLEFDQPYQVRMLCSAEMKITLVRAENDSWRGWYAPRYQDLTPALSLRAEARARECLFVTVLGPGSFDAILEDKVIKIDHDRMQGRIELEGDKTIVQSITWRCKGREERLG